VTILVSGGTGKVGGEVLRLAAERGVPVRALVRDRARAASALPDDIDIVEGDLADHSAIDEALDGAEAAFLAVGGTDDQQRLEEGFVDCAARRGVRVVKLSAFGVDAGSPVPYDRWHAAVEQRLTASGTAWTILRPTVFMQNLLGSADTIARGQLFAPAGEARVAQIDARDIAAVGLVALIDDQHAGRTYDLTGPQSLTYADVAAAFRDVLGRDVTYVDLPPDAFAAALAGSGMSPVLVESLTALMATIRAGSQDHVTTTVSDLLGRPPRDIRTFLADHRRAFAAEHPSRVSAADHNGS
jgi:uncharacterized protein YbjT (DUF2867 family)